MSVTPIYAGLIALLFVVLSVLVISTRRRLGIALGDAGNKELLRRQRAQANCAEYAPLALILIMLAELQSAPVLILHAAGIALLIGRVIHAAGVSREPERFAMRVTGMALTFIAILIAAAITLLWPLLSALLIAR